MSCFGKGGRQLLRPGSSFGVRGWAELLALGLSQTP